ncbi:MAG: hypothetical protein K8T25_02675, partial [Planctomycetia bacterium]|nr:hypothetical protein [Planctomycetia bacterium]
VPSAGAVYFNFYMTQLLYSSGGAAWGTWKPAMQQLLQNSQAVGGHVDGSWYWNSSALNPIGGANGGWGDAPWNQYGGRHFCTTLSMLCMEANFSRLKLGGSFGGGGQGSTVNVYAGTDQTVGSPNPASLSGSMWGGSSGATMTWSKVSGPGTVTFGNPNSLQTTATMSAVGTYVLRLTGTDGANSTTDDISINYVADNTAQYVRVRIGGSGNYLTLAEVQVFDTNTGTNVAPSGTASQVSTKTVGAISGAAQHAIDGQPGLDWASNSVAQTNAAVNPWWMVNLGSKRKLSKIVILCRSDSSWNWIEGATLETFATDPIANPAQSPLYSTTISGTTQGGTLQYTVPQ